MGQIGFAHVCGPLPANNEPTALHHVRVPGYVLCINNTADNREIDVKFVPDNDEGRAVVLAPKEFAFLRAERQVQASTPDQTKGFGDYLMIGTIFSVGEGSRAFGCDCADK